VQAAGWRFPGWPVRAKPGLQRQYANKIWKYIIFIIVATIMRDSNVLLRDSAASLVMVWLPCLFCLDG